MIHISNVHAGKKVRIQGIVPLSRDGKYTDDYIEGEGNHVGVITNVEGGKFWFREEGEKNCAFLKVSMWRIKEVLS